jgi:hypothetical protein
MLKKAAKPTIVLVCMTVIVLSVLVLVAAGMGETLTAYARLDLAGLREYRRRPGMPNLLSRQAFGLFEASYASADFRRKNGLWRDGRVMVPERGYFLESQRDTLARLQARGIVAP